MNDARTDGGAGTPGDDTPGDDTALRDLGMTLRDGVQGLDASRLETTALRRRARRRGMLATAAIVVAVVGIAGAFLTRGGDGNRHVASGDGGPGVDRILDSLDDQPVDPTKVKLVSTVETFPSCDALLGDLRRVGAEHVGSRGFGAGYGDFMPVAAMATDESRSVGDAVAADKGTAAAAPETGGETLGTNVQVEGVDELDHVKADGKWIYDLDGHGNLRITDSGTLDVVATVSIAPDPTAAGSGDGDPEPRAAEQLSALLEADGRVAVFGSRSVTSDPVPGDPSATRSSTAYATVTFVDATDPAEPTVTDRVTIEGTIVSARLVGGQVRLVTTSDMADLGFVLPTTPASVAKALDRNRRSVAASSVADWIPDWERDGEGPHALVPCERVHVPATFAGVAMTSLVSFPLGTGRFAPEATSIVAPGDTLYAGVDDVAVSSQVWVDPIDRDRLRFDDWKTAIHQFAFTAEGAPTYTGSGIVDGSTVGQFAFGEVGDALGVVTTKGVPWRQQAENRIDLHLLRPDGDGKLAGVATVDDLAGGKGAVSAVRFVPDRVLVSVGWMDAKVRVIDVSDPAHPRAGGTVTMPGETGYFHPLADHRALLVGQRSDTVREGEDDRPRFWVQAHLLDTSDPDAPRIVDTWEQPWVGDEVGWDHHAFTWWPQRDLAMWGLRTMGPSGEPPNLAAVLSVTDRLTAQALPEVSEAPETPAPCAEVDVAAVAPGAPVGKDDVVLRCDDESRTTVEWPRHSCSAVGDDLLGQWAPDQVGKGSVFLCNRAPKPNVSRVLVVDGRPILLTDQTLEALDPTTFASTAVVYHPTAWGWGGGFIG